MKALKFKLFATMITLAAVTIASIIPVQAQRRSTQTKTETTQPGRNRNLKSTVQKKSTFKDYDKANRRTVNSQLRSSRSNQHKSSSITTRKSRPQNKKAVTRNQKSSGSTQSDPRTINSYREQNRQTPSVQNRSRSSRSSNRNEVRTNSRSTASDFNGNPSRMSATKQYASTKTFSSSKRETVRRSTGTNTSNSRNFYRIDKSDKRYVPNKNYKGSKKYWSANYRGETAYNHKSGKYRKHYNYRKHNHWNHSWERYRWNHNSWRDYYYGYHPHSYTFHKHYYHHYHYGHVIRRFDYRPQVFVHNHHNYYCYNGHFFRYRRGIGYVLVDMPFGLSFEYLPHDYERVYINGYAYFRVGNLFFEWAGYGFRLVHYPERYYAYNNDYCNHGYHFNDDYYFDNY